jgi:hypothetical protein
VSIQPRTEVEAFVVGLEEFAGRRLQYRTEIGELMELAWTSGRQQVFADIAFFAKFITKAMSVMGRIGMDAEGYDKLANEFRDTSEKVLTLLRTLVKDTDEEVKQRFLQQFLVPQPETLRRLFALLAELAWVKNWQVDGKLLPWEQQ